MFYLPQLIRNFSLKIKHRIKTLALNIHAVLYAFFHSQTWKNSLVFAAVSKKQHQILRYKYFQSIYV